MSGGLVSMENRLQALPPTVIRDLSNRMQSGSRGSKRRWSVRIGFPASYGLLLGRRTPWLDLVRPRLGAAWRFSTSWATRVFSEFKQLIT